VLGAVSALLGIAHAAVQNRLSRVIAYSSIENTGLIVTGFGVALTGAAVGDRRLVAAWLLAATLQVVAHTVANDVMEVVETYLYRPALGFFLAVVTAAKRLQSGRLDAYLFYLLIALIAVIAVATVLA